MDDKKLMRVAAVATIVGSLVALLGQAAEQYQVPVAFVPDGDGWKVLHVLDWPAYSEDKIRYGTLSNAHALDTAAAAALRPLIELGERWERHCNRD